MDKFESVLFFIVLLYAALIGRFMFEVGSLNAYQTCALHCSLCDAKMMPGMEYKFFGGYKSWADLLSNSTHVADQDGSEIKQFDGGDCDQIDVGQGGWNVTCK